MENTIKNTNVFPNDITQEKNNSLEQEETEKVNNIKLINTKSEKDSINKENDNKFDDLFNFKKNNNNIVSYYYKTLQYLKDTKEYNYFQCLLQNSKNYIPKMQYNRNNNIFKSNKYSENNEKYINNYQQINDCIYGLNKSFYYNEQLLKNIKEYNKYLISEELILDNINKVDENLFKNFNMKSMEGNEKDITKGYFENSNLQTTNISCPPINPSNSDNNNNKQEKDKSCIHPNDSLSNDKESDSTSAISEKKEEENNKFNCSHKIRKEKKYKNYEKYEYIVEMFGKRGWVCLFCNNFNYETRNKCNRCGIIKKPKRIIDLKSNKENKINNELKDQNNKKGDWICINCNNLNYSFRAICNRCKIPKINQYLNDLNYLNNIEMFNYQQYPYYSFSPSFVCFNCV